MRQLLLVLALIVTLQLDDSTCNSNQLNIPEGNTDIYGVWQEGDSTVGSGLTSHFIFFESGKFIYNFSQYNCWSRIKSLYGYYKIENDSIYLSIKSRFEYIGGDIVESTGWVDIYHFYLEPDSAAIIEQENQDWFSFELNYPDSIGRSMEINWIKYYKVAVDMDVELQYYIESPNSFYNIIDTVLFREEIEELRRQPGK